MNILAVAITAAATSLLMPAIDFGSHGNNVPSANPSHARSTDFIIGDGDFNQVRPEYPTDPATEYRNHTLRLQYIESMLRNRDVGAMSADLRAARAENLDRLHDYWVRGQFPLNYEHPKAWEPCFIDGKGAICAVGYLVEQSEGRAVAEKIDSRYHFATIKQIDAPELAQWIAHSGLTKAEVVTIQGPSMEPGIAMSKSSINRSRRVRARAQTEPTKEVAVSIADPVGNDEPYTMQTELATPANGDKAALPAPAEPGNVMPVAEPLTITVATETVAQVPTVQTQPAPAVETPADVTPAGIK